MIGLMVLHWGTVEETTKIKVVIGRPPKKNEPDIPEGNSRTRVAVGRGGSRTVTGRTA